MTQARYCLKAPQHDMICVMWTTVGVREDLIIYIFIFTPLCSLLTLCRVGVGVGVGSSHSLAPGLMSSTSTERSVNTLHVSIWKKNKTHTHTNMAPH